MCYASNWLMKPSCESKNSSFGESTVSKLHASCYGLLFFNSWTLRMSRYSIVTCFSIFAHSPPLFRKCFHPFFLLSCIFSVEYVPLFFLEVVDFPCVIQGRTVKRFYEMTKDYFKLCIFINLNSEESQFFFSKDFKDFAFSWQSVKLLYLVIS